MEGQQRERTSSRRRQRRKAKPARTKVVVEPVLIVARRPDSPLLKNGFHTAVASAQPKHSGSTARGGANGYSVANGHSMANGHAVTNGHSISSGQFASDVAQADGSVSARHGASNGFSRDQERAETDSLTGGSPADNVRGSDSSSTHSDTAAEAGEPALGSDASTRSSFDQPRGDGVRRRAVRIVKVTDPALGPGNREQQLLDRLVRSQGRGAISRAADDLWENKFVAPKLQEVQIQLLEHENEHRARDAVFVMAELLQREAPIKRPVLDQRLRRLEQSAEDPITRDAAGALRRSMRVHHGA